MFAANTYVIRPATESDAAALDRVAALDGVRPLAAPVLLGEIGGAPAAAISLADGRTAADPFQPTAHLLAQLRMRAHVAAAVERTPSLADRLRAGLRRPASSPAAA